jgi:signal transduction histidine kinase/CheY-like chemotaxis protein
MKGNKRLILVRWLYIAGLLLVLLFVSLAVFLRQNNLNVLRDSLSVMERPNTGLDMIEKSIYKLHYVENDFRFYTLTYKEEYYKSYISGMNEIIAINDAMKKKLSKEDNDLTDVEKNLRLKMDLSNNFLHLKKITDSLQITSLNYKSVVVDQQKQEVYRIPTAPSVLHKLTIDTVNTTISTQKEKKGFFKKIKSFFSGSKTSETKTNKVVVKTSQSDSTGSSDSVATNPFLIYNKLLDETDAFYKQQIAQYIANQKQLNEKEKNLIQINSKLINEIERVFIFLKENQAKLHASIKQRAADRVAKSALEIGYMAMVAFSLIIALVILIFINTRKINKYQQQIEAARIKAERDADAKGKFLAYMSHELRTPLSTIVGFVDQFDIRLLNESQLMYFNAIQESSAMLHETVNNILDFSALEVGKMRFISEEFKPGEVVTKMVASLRPLAHKKNLEIKLTIDESAHATVSGDVFRLKQVLTNLITNAIKYSDKGEIHISCRLHQGSVKKTEFLLTVQDNGIGIAKENLGKVFEEFTRVDDNSNKKLIVGTGLGLPICRRIILQQQGEINVESELGAGSTFSVKIPYAKVKQPKRKEITADEPIDILKLSGKKILIVDDNRINILLSSTILAKWQVGFDTACDGMEAFDKFRQNHFDLVLTDIYMPNMDGMELTRQIRALNDPLKSKVPIIAITANIIPEDLIKYKEEGMSDFLIKPYASQDLYAKLIAELGL